MMPVEAQSQQEKQDMQPEENRIPREKRKQILHMWWNGMKAILQQGMLPRVLISIRVDSHLEKKFQINITYPGLTAKQAMPLLGMAFEAIAKKAKAEDAANGPQIIIPN